MRAHLVQMNMAWHDKERNFRMAEEMLDRAGVEAWDLVVLPEMFDTGFSWDTAVTADKDGRTLAFLSRLADDLGCFVMGGRTVHRCDCAKASNVVSVVAPGNEVVAEYAKIHMFPLGEEPRFIEPGKEIVTFHWREADDGPIVCPAICYDLRFPELFRAGLAKGAEVFVLPACWLEGRHAHWKALLVARAIENQAYVLGVNRTGVDPNARYLGGSVAIGPRGEVIGELGEEAGVLSVEIDVGEVRGWRRKFPAWRDAKMRN
ncbi:MAG: carbon-nitrogen family hydrolase [Phycisphaerales bacterium]|nr:carbon-nitrogen family hydrolase [Phycisphaerales bacterium]